MTIKRKVTFQEDANINLPHGDGVQWQKIKKLRRCSSNSVVGGQTQSDPLSWYSSMELLAVRKNAMDFMKKQEDDNQNQEMRHHLLHRSFQAHRQSSSSESMTNDNEDDSSKNCHLTAEPPYDEGAAQRILDIWTTGDLRFGFYSSMDDDCRRGMENLCSSRLATIRRQHRKRVAVGVMLAQQRYKEQGDLHDRIAQVSRFCSTSSRRFASLMGEADALAAAHIHMINIHDQQPQQQCTMMMTKSENDIISTRPNQPPLDVA